MGSSLTLLAREIHGGRAGLLQYHSCDLLCFVFVLREQGMGVSTRMIRRKAEDLSCDFCGKSLNAKQCTILRWLKANSLKFCMGTNVTQRPQEVTAEESRDLLANVARKKVSKPNRNPKFIINMDQMPVFLLIIPRKQLKRKGPNLSQCAPPPTATKQPLAENSQLFPMRISKGVPTGWIVTKEFPTYLPICVYALFAFYRVITG